MLPLWILVVALLVGGLFDLYYEWPITAAQTSSDDGIDYRGRIGISDGYLGYSDEPASDQEHAAARIVFDIHPPSFGPPVDLGDWFGLAALRVATWLVAASLLGVWWGYSKRKGKNSIKAEQGGDCDASQRPC